MASNFITALSPVTTPSPGYHQSWHHCANEGRLLGGSVESDTAVSSVVEDSQPRQQVSGLIHQLGDMARLRPCSVVMSHLGSGPQHPGQVMLPKLEVGTAIGVADRRQDVGVHLGISL